MSFSTYVSPYLMNYAPPFLARDVYVNYYGTKCSASSGNWGVVTFENLLLLMNLLDYFENWWVIFMPFWVDTTLESFQSFSVYSWSDNIFIADGLSVTVIVSALVRLEPAKARPSWAILDILLTIYSSIGLIFLLGETVLCLDCLLERWAPKLRLYSDFLLR